MTPWWGSLPLFAIALVLSIAIGAMVGALAVVALRARLLSCNAAARHRALLVLAALPMLVGLTLTLSASLPPLVALAVPALDHCDVHDDAHAHLCFRHVPHGPSPIASALLVVLAMLGAARITRAALRVRRTRRVLRALLGSGEADATLGVTIVESTLPICMAAGLLHPRIVIARELLACLDPEQRGIVLAHERAHLERHDTLALALGRALSTFHLPPVGRWLRAELGIAAEQACDEEAARRTGDRVAIAATILAMQRAWTAGHANALVAAGPGFAMHALERRVCALLDEPDTGRSLALHGWCLLAIMALTVAAAGVLHHWTESVISRVAL